MIYTFMQNLFEIIIWIYMLKIIVHLSDSLVIDVLIK